MKWIKKGLVLSEIEASGFDLYNTQVPYAFLKDGNLRIYFGARKSNTSSAGIYYIEVDPLHPENKLYFPSHPVLSGGNLGAFDQDGVLPVCLKNVGDEIYLYYGGLRNTHPILTLV